MRTLTPALLFLAAAALFVAAGAPAADQPKAPPAPAADDAHDFVFLGESRPVLVRLHVHLDGRSLQAAWDDCIDYLFRYLDVNNDGVLTKEELERAPTADQLSGGARGFAAFGGGPAAGLKLEAVDSDGDGKVTRAELAAYYRKSGFAPFQFNFGGAGANPLAMVAVLYGGGRPEPSVEAVSKAIFDLLDTNKDGKLSKEELEAAPDVLLKLDADEDEMITPKELVPDTGLGGNALGAMLAMGGPGNREQATSSPQLVPVTKPGEVPADLVRRVRERYGKPEQKLKWKDLGLDDATVKQLDANGDGVADDDEVGAFVKRTPDVELVLRLGKKKDTESSLEVVPQKGGSPLAEKLRVRDGLAQLDLGPTRAEFRGDDQAPPDRIALMRQDYQAQFRQADTNGDGVVDAAEARANRRFNRLFKVMDRDGDGKVTEKEFAAYFDHLEELQKRVAAGSVILALSDQSRGLFDLLDTDRDGRLSVREMRQAPKLLAQLDRTGKGHLTRDDVPRTYRMDLRRGSLNVGADGLAVVADLYSSSYGPGGAEPQRRGPLWFQKMDKNRDGDVSRKEWLFSEELFKKIDTDGDGLISVEEAEKADALFRREAEKSRR
jgi:Ca2+-binding EF-hand superfamily protein